MKKLLSLIAATSILIVSCTKSANNPQNGNSNGSILTVVSKEFVITKFTDNSSGTDKASLFNGYTFIFNANGTITAIKNNIAEEGSYTQKSSHEGEAAKLTIAFSNVPLSELNKQFQIDLISNNTIHLSDDGNASELLQFAAK